MNLYLVRHGRYAPLDVSMSCPLSLEGRAEISRLADYFSNIRLKVPTIIHSAKLRAKQTAAILKGALGDAQCEFIEGLEPNDPIHPMLKLINTRDNDLMLVGHLPFIAKLTDQLLSVSDELNVVDYQPGTAVCLTNDSGQWCIHWVLRSSIY